MRKSMLVAAAIVAAVCSAPAWSAGLVRESSDTAECAVDAKAFASEASLQGRNVSVPAFTVGAGKSAAQRATEMQALHQQLVGDAPVMAKAAGPGFSISLDRQELQSIGDCPDCAPVTTEERRYLVGLAKPVGLEFDLAKFQGGVYAGAFAGGTLAPTLDGGFVWSTSISSKGAHAMRVGFQNLDLPGDAELYVYNANGEAFGPYTGRGMQGSGSLVSNAVTGDKITVQLRFYGLPTATDLAKLKFTIAEAAHIGSRFVLAGRVNPQVAASAKAFCSYNATCVQNGECFGSADFSPIASVRAGVAHMLFQSGSGFYICSGGLLGNTANDQRPLFLTANHCISTSQEAGSLETFWDFRAASCSNTAACDFSYAQMRTDFPTTLGATMLAHGTSGDYSLMELSEVPEGTPRTFLGFSTTAVANTSGFDLFRLSHPKGSPQAFSRQDVNTTAGTCQTLPRGTFIYSTDSTGATEGGSSGSPVLNASGQVVGQLYGACGTNLNNVCAFTQNRTVDGAMASYYPNVSAYLNPSGGGGGIVAHIGNIVLSTVAQNGGRTRGVATVTVLNASNQPVSGASVAGTFSGFYAGSASGTTNSSGVAVLQSSPKKGSGTVAFCVTGVTGTNITYNSSANVETCN